MFLELYHPSNNIIYQYIIEKAWTDKPATHGEVLALIRAIFEAANIKPLSL
jgi:hypothetical protein